VILGAEGEKRVPGVYWKIWAKNEKANFLAHG